MSGILVGADNAGVGPANTAGVGPTRVAQGYMIIGHVLIGVAPVWGAIVDAAALGSLGRH